MADIKKNVNINVKTTGAKKATKELTNLNDGINKTNQGYKKHSKSAREYDRNMKGNSQMSANASKNFSKQAQGMQGVLVPAYAEVAARVFALTAAYTALVRAADFSILLQGQQLYAQQTGRNLGIVAKQLQEASGYQLDFAEASRAAGLSGTAGLTTKQMIQITSAARTASIALGVGMPDAFSRLTRGIVKGEPEILDEIGVLMRLDTVYSDFAKTVGKSANTLTESEKLQARFAFATGQISKNMGDLASDVSGNPFAQLGASVSDAVMELGAGFTDILKPIIVIIKDFKDGILLAFALIVKNLATKVFPAFGGMAKKFEESSKRIKLSARNAAFAQEKAQKRAQDAVAKTIDKRKALGKMIGQAEVRGARPGSGIAQGLATGNEKQFIRSYEQALNSAKRALEDKRLTKGYFFNSAKAIKEGEKNLNDWKIAAKDAGSAATQGFNQVNKYVKKANAGVIGLKSSVMAFTSSVATARTQTAKLVDKFGFFKGTAISMKLLKKEVYGLYKGWSDVNNQVTKFGINLSKTKTVLASIAVGATGLATRLGTSLVSGIGGLLMKGLSAFSWISIAGIVMDGITGADAGFARFSSTVSKLRSNLEEITETALKGSKKLDTIFATRFVEAAKSQEFKTNLANQLSETVQEASKGLKIDQDAEGAVSGLARLIDRIKGLFGKGTKGDLAGSFKDLLRANQAAGADYAFETEQMLRNLLLNNPVLATLPDEYNKRAEALRNLFQGIATETDFEKILDVLARKSKDELAVAFRQVTTDGELFSLMQQRLGRELSDGTKAIEKQKKAVEDLSRSMKVKTDFDDFAEAFNQIVSAFNNMSQPAEKAKFFLDRLGGQTFDIKPLQEYQTLLNKVQDLQEQRSRQRPGDQDSLGRIDNELAKVRDEIITAEAKLKGIFKGFDFAGALTDVAYAGNNPVEVVQQILERTTDIEKKKRLISLLDNTSLTAISKVKEYQKDILKLEEFILMSKLAQYKLDPAANAQQIAAYGEKIKEVQAKILDIDKDRTKELTKQAQEQGRQVTYIEKIKNELNKLPTTGDGFDAGMAYLNSQIAIKTAEKLVAATRDAAADFKAALDTVAGAFKQSMTDTFKGYFTGTDQKPFRQTLGEGFIDAGAGMFSELTTEGIFSRGGLLGRGVKSLLPASDTGEGGLFDMLFPPSAEEIAERQLNQLEELKKSFEKGTAKVQIVTGKTTESIAKKDGLISEIMPYDESKSFGDADESVDWPSKIKQAIEDPAETLTKELDKTLNTNFLDGFSKKFTEGVDIFGGIFKDFGKGFGNFFNMNGGSFLDFGSLFSTLLGSYSAGGGGLLGGGFDFLSLLGFANGGIAKGGFRMYANGGIATQPHLGMVGEGKYNEAIVPLPDGKSIPVIGNTGGGNTNNVTVNVQVDSNGRANTTTEGDQNNRELGHRISQAVQEEIMMQQRPGGLLSQYKN